MCKAEYKNLYVHAFISEDPDIDSLMNKYFIKLMINYSRENKNLELLKELDFPQRFGFLVFVILDQDGKPLHTQNSALLEAGKAYDKDKVIRFLNNWKPAALKEEYYKDYK